MARKGIKGFSALRVFPITTDTTSAYTVGSKIDIPTAESATTDRKTEEYVDYADDEIYDQGEEFAGETLQIVVQELELDLMSKLDGADYDEETGEYTWGPGAVAPQYALAFRALRRDGGYRMVKYFSTHVTSIKISGYQTKGTNKDGSKYTISFAAAQRRVDGKSIRIKDTATSADLSWLDTVDNIPAGG